MAEPRAIAERLYAAFASADGPGLLALLHSEFEGHVSAGMALGVGGVHRGGEAMLRDVWAPVFLTFGMRPHADRLLETTDGEIVALGRYVGDDAEAAFAHVLTFAGEQVIRLEQITDTNAWPTTERV